MYINIMLSTLMQMKNNYAFINIRLAWNAYI